MSLECETKMEETCPEDKVQLDKQQVRNHPGDGSGFSFRSVLYRKNVNIHYWPQSGRFLGQVIALECPRNVPQTIPDGVCGLLGLIIPFVSRILQFEKVDQ